MRKFIAQSNLTNRLCYLFIDDCLHRYETDYFTFYNDFDIVTIDYLTFCDIIKGLNVQNYTGIDLYKESKFRSIK